MNISILRKSAVTRDMELIRKILLSVQSKTDLDYSRVVIEGVDATNLGRHVEMLFEAGMIEGMKHGNDPGGFYDILVTDLSWSGHDFVAALANGGVWDKIKNSFSASELATIPLSVIKDIGVDLLKSWAKSKVGF